MDEQKRHKLIIIGSGIAFALIVIVIIILYILDLQKNATLQTVIAPSFSKIIIDGKKYNANQDIRLRPGDYTITIEASDFQTQTKSITLPSHQTTTLALYLNPNQGDAYDWYENHETEYSYFLSAAGRLTNQAETDYLEKNPIANILPFTYVDMDPTTYVWTEYEVRGGNFDGCKTDYCIKIIDTTGGNRQAALDEIRKRGYNPDDYQILYEYVPIIPLD